MKVQNTATLFNNRLKFVVYAPPGNGKTYLARTISEPTLIISAEAGLLSLAGTNIDVIDISVNDEGQVIPSEQRIVRLKDVYTYLCTEDAKAKYKWIFLDSISEIAQNMVDSLQKEFPDRKDSLVLYGENSKRMRGLIKAFRDLPWYNVVMTALADDDKDEQNRRIKSISMVGKIAQQLPAYFDECFYLHVYENDQGVLCRKLVTRPNEKIIAKDRSGKLEQYEEPNLQMIANKIRGEVVT